MGGNASCCILKETAEDEIDRRTSGNDAIGPASRLDAIRANSADPLDNIVAVLIKKLITKRE